MITNLKLNSKLLLGAFALALTASTLFLLMLSLLQREPLT